MDKLVDFFLLFVSIFYFIGMGAILWNLGGKQRMIKFEFWVDVVIWFILFGIGVVFILENFQ